MISTSLSFDHMCDWAGSWSLSSPGLWISGNRDRMRCRNLLNIQLSPVCPRSWSRQHARGGEVWSVQSAESGPAIRDTVRASDRQNSGHDFTVSSVWTVDLSDHQGAWRGCSETSKALHPLSSNFQNKILSFVKDSSVIKSNQKNMSDQLRVTELLMSEWPGLRRPGDITDVSRKQEVTRGWGGPKACSDFPEQRRYF